MSEIETKRDPHATLRAMLAAHAECTATRCEVEISCCERGASLDAAVAFDGCGFVQDAAKHGIDLPALLADSDALRKSNIILDDLAQAILRIGFDRDITAVRRHAERVVMWLDGGAEPHSIGTSAPIVNELRRLRCELRLFHEKELEGECACDSCAAVYAAEEKSGLIEPKEVLRER